MYVRGLGRDQRRGALAGGLGALDGEGGFVGDGLRRDAFRGGLGFELGLALGILDVDVGLALRGLGGTERGFGGAQLLEHRLLIHLDDDLAGRDLVTGTHADRGDHALEARRDVHRLGGGDHADESRRRRIDDGLAITSGAGVTRDRNRARRVTAGDQEKEERGSHAFASVPGVKV